MLLICSNGSRSGGDDKAPPLEEPQEAGSMKSVNIQKSPIKEEASSTRSNTPVVDASRGVASGDQAGFYGFDNNDIRKFHIPFEALRSFRLTPSFMIQSKKEELLLRLCELFFFLRRLELRLVDLCLKDSVDLKKLSVLADEVTELKGVAREALAYFHEAAQSVEPPFQPGGNDFPESEDKSQDDCGSNRDEDSFNDVDPVNSSEHGRENNR